MTLLQPTPLQFSMRDITTTVFVLALHLAAIAASLRHEFGLSVTIFGLSQIAGYVFVRSRTPKQKRIALDAGLAAALFVVFVLVLARGRIVLMSLVIGVKELSHLTAPLEAWYGMTVVALTVGVWTSITAATILYSVQAVEELGRDISLVGWFAVLMFVSWKVMVSCASIPILPD